MESIERLGFELSTAAWAEQERTLTGLRSRAATVLATASVSSSLASAEIARASLGLLSGLAMAAFVLALLISLWIMLPHELGLGARGGDVFALEQVGRTPDLSEVYRETAVSIDACVRTNQAVLRRLAVWLTMSCLLLSVGIVLQGVEILR